jgi:hypothetical protein
VRRSFVAVFAGVTVAGLAAGCTFTPPRDGGGDDDGVQTFVDDTAQDFADPTTLVGATLHPRGAIDPETYAVGGLHMSAYAMAILQPGNTVSWAQLEEMVQNTPPTGTRQAAQVDIDYGTTQPFGVGLNVIDNFTLVYRGEIYLDAQVSLTLESDGPALVEIATDGTFNHQLYDQADTGNPASPPKLIDPPAPGWYPIRAALTDTVGGAFIHLKTMAGPISPARLRSRTTAAAGLVVEGFEDPSLVTPAGIGIEAQDLQRDFGTARPTWDFSLTSPADYGARLRGQWLVETPGTYRLGAMVDGDDFVRLWLDGKVASSKWGPGDAYEDSESLELAAGWHDFAIDLGGVGGRSGFVIRVVEAPSGVPTGVIPSRLLRPVVRFGQLEPVTLGALAQVINDNTTTNISLPPASLAVPADAVVQAVDVGFDLNHGAAGQVTVKLVHPDGTADTLRANDATERPFELYGARTAFAGKPLAPSAVWKLAVEDNALGVGGSITRIMAAISYRGGVPPVTPMALFESKPRPLPAEATEIVAVRTVPAAPAGATIAISIRTCETEDACAAAELQPVADEKLAIPAAPFVEYKLELGSDGWALPAIERVEIDYRVR